MLKFCMYTSYKKVKKLVYFQGQSSSSLGLYYKEFWHLDPFGQDIARTMQFNYLFYDKNWLFVAFW